MKDTQSWKTEIEQSISRLKEKGIHTYYAMSAEMTKETRDELVMYFSQFYYALDFKKCPKGLYDVIIRF